MNNDIKLLKSQSLLKEVLQEAISSLSDNRLNSLSVLDVKCSKGKYCARVFLDPTSVTKEEQKALLSLLRRANSAVAKYVKSSLSWYRIPDFNYEFDDHLEHINRLESIFDKISKGGVYE